MSIYISKGWVYTPVSDTEKVPEGEYLTVQEYAESFRMDPKTVHKWIERGKLQYIKVSNRFYIPVGVLPQKSVNVDSSRHFSEKCDKKV